MLAGANFVVSKRAAVALFFTVFACLVVYVNDVKLIAIVIINPVN